MAFNENLCNDYESAPLEAIKAVYKTIHPETEITVAEQGSHWDMIATVNEKVLYIENKTRNISYKVYKDEGYYLDPNKVDGTIDLFNFYFPKDNVLMVTNFETIKDLQPQETYVKKDVYCDPDSGSKKKPNIIIPYDRFWVYDTTNNKKISTPKNGKQSN